MLPHPSMPCLADNCHVRAQNRQRREQDRLDAIAKDQRDRERREKALFRAAARRLARQREETSKARRQRKARRPVVAGHKRTRGPRPARALKHAKKVKGRG